MKFLELLKVILFGLVEGYTEFLPISSTGHLILVENLVHLDQPAEFFNVFKMVIQVGAILAVVWIYWTKLWPFRRNMKTVRQTEVYSLWVKIVIACLPAAVIGILFDDYVDAYLSTPTVIGITLILYGAIFILLERYYKKEPVIFTTKQLDYKTAFLIGLFQCLSIIPGTSRSGATIIGAILLGVARPAGAEFSFLIGIPVICGSALLKLLKYGFDFTGQQWLIMLLGIAVSFITALLVVRSLIHYLKNHTFEIFGWYRIILGIIVLLYFGFAG